MSSDSSNKNVLSGGRQEEQIPSCICADEEREDPPVKTPCCKQFIHKSCLAAAFNAFPYRRPICPFCRAILYPLNGDEPPPRHASDYESDENETDGFYFNPPLVPRQAPNPPPPPDPIPVPPPGWHEHMALHHPPRSTFSSGRPG